MQTKDITDALGITRERIKYYKKEGVFFPENPVANRKTEYTDRDFENLKRLVILTKSGLSCADIKKVQTGAKSLREVINDRQNAIREEIERMTGSLALSEELFSADVQYDSMPIFCTATDSKILPPQFRVQHTLNTGIAVIEVAVEHNPIAHSPALAFISLEVL